MRPFLLTLLRFIKAILLFAIYLMISYTLIFFSMHLSGGSPFPSDLPISQESYQELYSSFYLDLPLYKQYYLYLLDILTLNWGYSFSSSFLPLAQLLAPAILVTSILSLSTMIISIPLALFLAIHAYFSPYRWMRIMTSHLILLLGSMPSIILAPLLFLWSTQHLPFLVTAQAQWYHPEQFIFITIMLALPYSALFAKLLYSHLQFHQNNFYFKQLQAMGFPLRKILWFLRVELLLPINKHSGIAFAQLLGGSIFIEEFFRIVGVGSLSIKALHHRDYPLILLSSLFFAVNLLLLTNISHYLQRKLDPRIGEVNLESS